MAIYTGKKFLDKNQEIISKTEQYQKESIDKNVKYHKDKNKPDSFKNKPLPLVWVFWAKHVIDLFQKLLLTKNWKPLEQAPIF